MPRKKKEMTEETVRTEAEVEATETAELAAEEFKDEVQIILPKKEPDRVNRIEVASKRKKRSLYAQEDVVTVDGEIRKIKKEETAQYKTYMELAASVKNGTVLTGRITGRKTLEKNKNTDNPITVVCAVIDYGKNFEVLIPACQLTDMSIQPKRKNDQTEADQYKDLVNRRIGSTVDFVVERIIEEECTAIANRITAMAKKARRYFTDSYPGADDAKIKIDMFADGRVVQANTRGLWIEVGGVETFIEKNEISWTRISDPSEIYVPGQEVMVRILDVDEHVIEYDPLGRPHRRIATVKIKASIKQTEMNPNKRDFDKILVNDTGEAIVTQITEFGIFVIYRDKYSVKCKLQDAPKQPEIGAKVLIAIKSKDEETYQINGEIRMAYVSAN